MLKCEVSKWARLSRKGPNAHINWFNIVKVQRLWAINTSIAQTTKSQEAASARWESSSLGCEQRRIYRHHHHLRWAVANPFISDFRTKCMGCSWLLTTTQPVRTSCLVINCWQMSRGSVLDKLAEPVSLSFVATMMVIPHLATHKYCHYTQMPQSIKANQL